MYVWHDLTYILRKCRDCGIDQLLTCPIEELEDSSITMQWNHYKMVVHMKTIRGKDCQILHLQYKTTAASEFLKYLMPGLKSFIVYNHVAK
jgi:hypothetical protein